MHLVVYSHKPCWIAPRFKSGYATDGGFPFQIRALSELFDSTTLLVPVVDSVKGSAGIPLIGHNLTVVALSNPAGKGVWRKLGFPLWALRHSPALIGHAFRAEALHTLIPGDVGTVGMLLALLLRKPLLVRHCGNWDNERTLAERFWKWFMEQFRAERNVMLKWSSGFI